MNEAQSDLVTIHTKCINHLEKRISDLEDKLRGVYGYTNGEITGMDLEPGDQGPMRRPGAKGHFARAREEDKEDIKALKLAMKEARNAVLIDAISAEENRPGIRIEDYLRKLFEAVHKFNDANSAYQDARKVKL